VPPDAEVLPSSPTIAAPLMPPISAAASAVALTIAATLPPFFGFGGGACWKSGFTGAWCCG
jgi:hypothetical protein